MAPAGVDDEGRDSGSSDDNAALTEAALSLLRTRELYKYYSPASSPGTASDSDDGSAELPYRTRDTPSPPADPAAATPPPLASRSASTLLAAVLLLAASTLRATRALLVFADQRKEYLIASSEPAREWLDAEAPALPQEPRSHRTPRSANGRRHGLFTSTLAARRPNTVVEIAHVREDPLLANDQWLKEDFPHAQFYAGVPLFTRAGIPIGVLCILDDNESANVGLGERGQRRLTKLAESTVEYLELVRGEREKRRGRRMEIALSRFVAGSFGPDMVALTGGGGGEARVRNENQREKGERMVAERNQEAGERDLREDVRRSERKSGRQRLDRAEEGDSEVDEAAAAEAEEAEAPPPDERRTGRKKTKSTAKSSPKKAKNAQPIGHYGLPFKVPDMSPPRRRSKKRESQSASSEESSASSPFDPVFMAEREQNPHFQRRPSPVTRAESNGGSTHARSSTNSEDLGEQIPAASSLANMHRRLFSRAATLMHEALEVDGVAFISPDLEGLSDFTAPGQAGISNHTSTSADAARSAREKRNKGVRTTSGVLGYSTSVKGKPTHGGDENIKSTADLSASHLGIDASELDEAFLGTLTESWPRGCIFAYSATKPSHPVITVPLPGSGDESSNSDSEPPQIISTADQTATAEVLRVLRKFVSGTKSILFVPLYDYVGKVFAVAFAWTTRGTRVFRGKVEGQFVSAFGDCIMAEVSRGRVISDSVSKSNFISSVSHELRSPLHGALASCELLSDTALDAHQTGLLEAIAGCSRTLLDTVNHVLTFKNLNSNTNDREDRRQLMLHAPTDAPAAAEDASSKSSSSSTDQHPQLMPTNLAKLVEEVVETSHMAHEFPRALERIRSGRSATTTGPADAPGKLSNDVFLSLDIDPNVTTRRYLVPPGAVRRIVLNLCTNAIKYTSRGWVKLALTSQPAPAEDGQAKEVLEHEGPNEGTGVSEEGSATSPETDTQKRLVTLTVSDSGRGISREFLKTSLFTPFVQENPLQTGVGLGMSIVRQIVEELGGRIDVRSEVNVGTEIRVSFVLDSIPAAQPDGAKVPRPLEVPVHNEHDKGAAPSESGNDSDDDEEDVVAVARRKLAGKRIWLGGFEPPGIAEDQRDYEKMRVLKESLVKTLTNTLDMKIVPDPAAAPADANPESREPTPSPSPSPTSASASALEQQISALSPTDVDFVAVLANNELDSYLSRIERTVPGGADGVPLIELGCHALLANKTAAATKSKSSSSARRDRGISCLARPYGPSKLAGAMLHAWDDFEARKAEGSPASTPNSSRRGSREVSDAEEAGRTISGVGLVRRELHEEEQDRAGVLTPPRSESASVPPPSSPSPPPDTPGVLMRSRTLSVLQHTPTGNPARERSRSKSVSQQNDEPPPPHGGEQHPGILIVEDNAVNMMVLTTFLKKRGHAFVTASNGLEALRAVEDRTDGKGFDMILMDVQMPVMNGIEATRAIRALEAERGSKATGPTPEGSPNPANHSYIVAVTAISGDRERREAEKAGVDLFCVKPVKMGWLKALVKERERAKGGPI